MTENKRTGTGFRLLLAGLAAVLTVLPAWTHTARAADAKTAFRAAHTLKGVALNLGLTALAGVCSEMTEALRGSDTLPASAPALFEAVQREYDRVTGALAQLAA